MVSGSFFFINVHSTSAWFRVGRYVNEYPKNKVFPSVTVFIPRRIPSPRSLNKIKNSIRISTSLHHHDAFVIFYVHDDVELKR